MKKLILYISFLFFSQLAFGQNISLLSSLSDSIELNAKLMAGYKDENSIFYSDKLENIIEKFTSEEKSINFSLDSIKYIKVLTSEDHKFRIFTWVLPSESGGFLFKGYVQTYSSSEKQFKTYKLNDQTDKISSAYNKTLSPEKWYGAYYYKIITVKRGSKVFYTLLGWKGIDKTKQSKVIEIVSVNPSGVVSFGYSMFNLKNYEYFEKNSSHKRLLFEYSTLANMYMDYDLQTVVVKITKSNKTINNKPKSGFGAQGKQNSSKTKEKTFKGNMIVLDRLVPINPELLEFHEFYYPESNVMDGLYFEKNLWKYYPDIDARNKPELKQKNKYKTK